jgi:hypothetical protein
MLQLHQASQAADIQPLRQLLEHYLLNLSPLPLLLLLLLLLLLQAVCIKCLQSCL